ncbi:bifunctional [glutamate--ammonia ligase]-adenylyl-L-tyrosine phosphorylase/[glutamate--ammonia-ligase] adenylyltransferase [Thiococcus pfennigii]|uniref:bifunctional [glutamate--ammonia ligase]-adenylyl-L-tyrosine phosphorylase/[glutamate--ammonia-ligase] adenylyltransferase n=1 Tax=Thiococcus pfennigii TaxID=1057 RepID=UPI0019056F64|nr:bifunctional [glutamate--ammonia ligase]-adenylyl-L-tyrosine phosphorylase/[glutamate--ammonia-ligase] adenylyltransferase [Thiococcus pfennigii]MBK1732041.1 bifunctional glutamine synthetase adenylyltransferase/deadenyltransferase [Thiococcus pfennigii]
MSDDNQPRPTAAADHHWQSWLAWARERDLAPPVDPAWEAARQRVWDGSDYVASACACAPETLADLLSDGLLARPLGAGELAGELTATLADCADETALMAALRRFRRRHQVRIIWRDLAGWADLDETLAELSALADACIAEALDRLHAWQVAECGTPSPARGRPQRLLVLGMGKLGGRELNLSSDIDLIFAFPQAGQVDGPRALSNEQFFIGLARRLVRVLDTQTSDGFVFRVDTRLRPFGDAGPLATSFAALEDYYQSQAREWERYAMIKARVVAGDAQDGERLMALLRPFVYRRYLDYGVIESLRNLKQLIAKELKRKGMADNIKLGPGGIREIEFIGQAFQLVRGGRDPDLQVRPIRQVLAHLAAKGLVPRPATEALDAAYCFLRRVENRLQAWRDKQTHVLPASDAERARLARAMDFPDWSAFAAVLATHRQRVQAEFDRVFEAPRDAARTDGLPLADLWHGLGDGQRDPNELARAGFADPSLALTRLAEFRDATDRMALGERGRERLAQLMPLVLRVVAEAERPDPALERVLKVLEAVARRTAYLAMLVERPVVLSQLACLTGMSPWIAERIARYPLLLDELIDPARLYRPLQRGDLVEEAEVLLGRVAEEDLEQQMEYLRQFAQGNILRVAAADLTEVIPLMVVSDYLTEIAEVTLARVLDLANTHLVSRHGRPAGVAAPDTGLLVLGYGKLGGIELGYGSDLDLVFLHAPGGANAMTDGPREIANEQFFVRLGQRMIHMLTTRTASGVLYEVDMRLRPDGNKGLLARSLPSFADYQAGQAWTWEHQALVRARPVAGDAALAAAFAEVRTATLRRERDPGPLRDEVRKMREKMRANLDKSGTGRFDLKQGAGGIADIEFMVQYSVLRWAARHPELTRWTDNVRLLETLAGLDLLPGTAAADLTAAYKALRAAYHRSSLQGEPTTIAEDRLVDERARVRALWAQLMED